MIIDYPSPVSRLPAPLHKLSQLPERHSFLAAGSQVSNHRRAGLALIGPDDDCVPGSPRRGQLQLFSYGLRLERELHANARVPQLVCEQQNRLGIGPPSP